MHTGDSLAIFQLGQLPALPARKPGKEGKDSIRGRIFYRGEDVPQTHRFTHRLSLIINRLPSLPAEVQVVVLKPSSNGTKNSRTHRRFEEEFRAGRDHVEIWLKYLIEHHPIYKDFSINRNDYHNYLLTIVFSPNQRRSYIESNIFNRVAKISARFFIQITLKLFTSCH